MLGRVLPIGNKLPLVCFVQQSGGDITRDTIHIIIPTRNVLLHASYALYNINFLGGPSAQTEERPGD